jgi:hypothetical protein
VVGYSSKRKKEKDTPLAQRVERPRRLATPVSRDARPSLLLAMLSRIYTHDESMNTLPANKQHKTNHLSLKVELPPGHELPSDDIDDESDTSMDGTGKEEDKWLELGFDSPEAL